MELRAFFARFQVLTAVLLKIQVFWRVTPCRVVNDYRRFKGSYFHLKRNTVHSEAARHCVEFIRYTTVPAACKSVFRLHASHHSRRSCRVSTATCWLAMQDCFILQSDAIRSSRWLLDSWHSTTSHKTWIFKLTCFTKPPFGGRRRQYFEWIRSLELMCIGRASS
jgi:hypothetical protein